MRSRTPGNARQSILDSAINEFAHRGYSGASVQNILKATGLSKPTLYYYFGNKAGLFHAILDFAFDECLSRMEQRVAAAADTKGKLAAMASGLFSLAEERPLLLRLAFSSAFAAPKEIPAECVDMNKRRRNFEFGIRILDEARKAGDLDANYSATELTHGFYGAISHRLRMHLLCGEGKLDAKVARRVAELFLNGAGQR